MRFSKDGYYSKYLLSIAIQQNNTKLTIKIIVYRWLETQIKVSKILSRKIGYT